MISKSFLTILLTSSLSFSLFAQDVKVVKFDKVKEILENDSDKVRVINFWATWCAPCIKELPNFEAIHNKYDQAEVILINLDFVEGLGKVKRFVKDKELKSRIILLDEIDYNSWIDQVSTDWTGTIPATIIIGPRAVSKKFLEGELTVSELEKALEQIL